MHGHGFLSHLSVMVNKYSSTVQYTSASGFLSWILSSAHATSRASPLFSQTKPEIEHRMVVRAKVGNSGWRVHVAFVVYFASPKYTFLGSSGAFCQMRNSCSVTAVGQKGSGVARLFRTAAFSPQRLPEISVRYKISLLSNGWGGWTRSLCSGSCWDDPWSVSPWRTLHTAAAALRGQLIKLFAGVGKKKSDLFP